MLPSISLFLEYFGIVVFAISGALSAGSKRLDVFGVIVVALLASLGGGTLRDLLLDTQVVWIQKPGYLLAGILAALVTFVLVRLFYISARLLAICDAIGLAFFTIGGIQKALSLGFSPQIALLMGLMTGVAGGILRDIVCNEIPLIFHREVYALPALTGGTLFLVLPEFGFSHNLAMLSGMAVILLLRLAGVLLGLSLPAFLYSESPRSKTGSTAGGDQPG